MKNNTALHVPVVYAYNDFRKFLDDLQKARQEIDENFTKSSICKLRAFTWNVSDNGQLVSKCGAYIVTLKIGSMLAASKIITFMR